MTQQRQLKTLVIQNNFAVTLDVLYACVVTVNSDSYFTYLYG